jgi:SAM-dependent methyltransferase
VAASATGSVNAATGDRAGREYWDRVWADQQFPPDIAPRGTSLWLHRDRLLHQSIARAMQGRPPGLRLVELGCARSAWMPYFSREFSSQIAGLDYSQIGVEQTVERLNACGIPGDVRRGDLFDPPADWIGAFDIVSWFGVAEHFDDTAEAVRAAARLLKPGGLMITEIPNMSGLIGWMQRTLNKPIYDIHVPLTARQLAAHHRSAGLNVVSAEYVVPVDFGVVDIEHLPPGVGQRLKDRLLFGLRLMAGAVWWLDERLGPFRPGRVTGAFVVVTAEKPRA